ncbi:MAG: hypothetical protein IKN21_03175 [Prevotella sp.]|nr:hypothetical protein [Prevotella sp.]MBR7043684.1 hypothetical protein [Prevotella sp.]
MKKILMTAVVLLLTASANAQDVFKLLLQDAKTVAEDKSKDLETRKIATFKYDELSYMAMQVRDDVLRDSTDLDFFNRTVTMLNEQSFAMYEFIEFYFERLAAAKKKEERDIVITVFRNASINHPLFNDMDKELILSYYNNENYLTRFSLDTDWVKALAVVRGRNW